MDELERQQHRLHARLPGFQRKVEWTCQIMDDALAKDAVWYLAFSGGVDSTVVLHLLYQAGRHIDVLWGDDGYDYPESLDFLQAVEEYYGFHLHRIRCMEPWRDWCKEMGRPELIDYLDASRVWGNPRAWDTTWQRLADAHIHGYGGVFMGL